MGRLFVVSNRVARPGDVRAGGLAIALQGLLKRRRGVWFGWSGAFGDGPPQMQIGDGIRFCTLDLPPAEFEAYYHQFANRTLWPLLHYRGDLVHFDREAYEGYLAVNARFADALARNLRGDDIVWVHDYHFIPLARCLRQRGVRARIGFFLHIPMPSWDVLRMLPGHRELFAQLADYDLVGVQTPTDADNLRRYFAQFGVPTNGCAIDAFPVGIDADAVARDAAAPPAREAALGLHRSLSGRRLAIGVDRLDYSKGLPERFKAFARYLERDAAGHDLLTYLQIAPPSRGEVAEYRSLRQELEQLAGHINGLHARPDWTPLRYVNHCYTQAVLAGFYRTADLALVTPLRDGMNLVAKEYVAAQDPADPGVLVLSRFVGAAHELHEALLVNPHDIDETADTIGVALVMSRQERRERWQALMARVRANSVHAWSQRFLARLQEEDGDGVPTARRPDRTVMPADGRSLP